MTSSVEGKLSSGDERSVKYDALRSRRDGLTAGPSAEASAVRPGHPAVVESLVEDGLVHPGLERDLAQRAAGRRGLLHDLARAVVADERVERGRGRECQLRIALALVAIRLDPVDAALGEQPRRAREQVDRVEQVPRHE